MTMIEIRLRATQRADIAKALDTCEARITGPRTVEVWRTDDLDFEHASLLAEDIASILSFDWRRVGWGFIVERPDPAAAHARHMALVDQMGLAAYD